MVQSSLQASLRSFSRTTGIIALVVGTIVLLSWEVSLPGLGWVLGGLATMKANTALSFTLSGLAIVLVSSSSPAGWRRRGLRIAALAVVLLALATLCEYIFHVYLGIDRWVLNQSARAGQELFPDRMSLMTAVNFVLIGLAVFLLDRGKPQADGLAQILAGLIALLSGLSLLGYAFGATELYGLGAFNQIAAHSALTLLIVSAGLLCAHAENGFISILTGSAAGSVMARRLLPAVLILPVVLGWLGLRGQQGGLYDTQLALALLVSLSILVFAGLIWWTARLLNQTDAELQHARALDLRLSEERLRYVIWATRDAVWDRNLASGEIWWNDGLQKLFHYRANEIESNVAWWEAHIHPEDRPRVIQSIKNVLDTRQQLWSKEYRFQRIDGSYANVFDRAYILYDEHSREPKRMLGAMADMTDQKQIEQALRQSEELFAKAFSATPAGIILTDLQESRVVEANDAYLQLVGYSRSEILGQTVRDLGILSPADEDRLTRLFQEHGALRDVETEVRTKEGQLKSVLSSIELVEVGGVPCVLSVIYDITSRKEAEAAQQRSETLFRALFELSPDSVLVIDPHDTQVSWPIIDCNEAACLMNGYQRDELIGQSIDLLNGHVASESEREEYMNVLREQGHLKAEFQHLHKQGHFFPIETSTTLITIDGRELVIGIDRDITQRSQADEALHDANEKLAHGLTELRERNRESVLLNELGNLLQSCPNAEAAYRVFSESAAQLFPYAKGTLYIVDASHRRFEPVSSWNTQEAEERAVGSEECWALREDRAHLVDQNYANQLCNHIVGLPASSICIPLRAQGEVLGLFHLQYPSAQTASMDDIHAILTQPEQRLALTVADTIALAITNLKLRETLRVQSIRDALTGLYNRRFMEESLEREVSRARRSGHPVGMIMLDLDHFKNFNDTYGHEAGDLVLQDLGSFLQAHIRVGDIACRYGGEEFLLLMPDASLEITRQRAQKLCDEIRLMKIPYRGQLLGAVTLSLGVATFPEHGQIAADVVRAADKALYRAKRAGRDRVAVARRSAK